MTDISPTVQQAVQQTDNRQYQNKNEEKKEKKKKETTAFSSSPFEGDNGSSFVPLKTKEISALKDSEVEKWIGEYLVHLSRYKRNFSGYFPTEQKMKKKLSPRILLYSLVECRNTQCGDDPDAFCDEIIKEHANDAKDSPLNRRLRYAGNP